MRGGEERGEEGRSLRGQARGLSAVSLAVVLQGLLLHKQTC